MRVVLGVCALIALLAGMVSALSGGTTQAVVRTETDRVRAFCSEFPPSNGIRHSPQRLVDDLRARVDEHAPIGHRMAATTSVRLQDTAPEEINNYVAVYAQALEGLQQHVGGKASRVVADDDPAGMPLVAQAVEHIGVWLADYCPPEPT